MTIALGELGICESKRSGLRELSEMQKMEEGKKELKYEDEIYKCLFF